MMTSRREKREHQQPCYGSWHRQIIYGSNFAILQYKRVLVSHEEGFYRLCSLSVEKYEYILIREREILT